VELKSVSRLFAKWYDFLMGPLERNRFRMIRMNLLSKASGRVLEIGSGTGVNFPIYQSVESVTAIEPNQNMINLSLPKIEMSRVPIEVINVSAEHLPFKDASFDTVVATLVFCTIPDVEKAFLEMKRVCKPEGKILLFEHVKLDNPFLAKLQDWLTPVWKKVCDGCCLNRETAHLLSKHGFQTIQMRKHFSGLFLVMECHK
jgi:ubiquinone/menaquinone biosynthesis C-methylase UbiE